jgi:ABC-type thiamin/hydroxymethylpyrimidine transport system permease subunit
MNNNTFFDTQIYYRLIALWVVCEAFLGGMIHGLKLPVSGLLVGSCAVLCICLIAYYVPIKGAILKATVIVAVCKMMLSPQSPPPAYVAVFFQGLIGELLFFNKKYFRTACLLLGGIALFESAIQRVLVMTILYGKNLWTVLDEFINNLTHQKTITSYSILLVSSYILLHTIVGVLVGFYAGKIVQHSQQWGLLHTDYLIALPAENMALSIATKNSKKSKKLKLGLFIFWLVLLGLLLQSWLQIGKPILPKQAVVQILFRSFLIVLSWYFLISPLVMLLLKKWLAGQQQKSQTAIREVLLLLPSIKYIVQQSWQLSNGSKGLRRIGKCCKIVMMNTLQKPYDQ